MMASAVACIIGNLAYCLSYDARSLALLVIARLITGFGALLACPLHRTARCPGCRAIGRMAASNLRTG